MDLLRVSIHAPRGGSDGPVDRVAGTGVLFQSTLPAGGATPVGRDGGGGGGSFNPRSPRGERRNKTFARLFSLVSIHAPRGGSDVQGLVSLPRGRSFNPRSPRGERPARLHVHPAALVSIHAPRGGSDDRPHMRGLTGTGFNPRSPRGERLVTLQFILANVPFQSTLPTGGATDMLRKIAPVIPAFQSTLPAGGATATVQWGDPLPEFQSTLPAGGATINSLQRIINIMSFNPRSPRGERQHAPCSGGACKRFNPRSPRGERHDARVPVVGEGQFQSTLPAG